MAPYTGYTTDVERRPKTHNSGSKAYQSSPYQLNFTQKPSASKPEAKERRSTF